MTDAPDKHERRFPTLAVVLCVLIVLPVVYVLSTGPFFWLVAHKYVNPDGLMAEIYAPLGIITDHWPLGRRLLEAYWSLWR